MTTLTTAEIQAIMRRGVPLAAEWEIEVLARRGRHRAGPPAREAGAAAAGQHRLRPGADGAGRCGDVGGAAVHHRGARRQRHQHHDGELPPPRRQRPGAGRGAPGQAGPPAGLRRDHDPRRGLGRRWRRISPPPGPSSPRTARDGRQPVRHAAPARWRHQAGPPPCASPPPLAFALLAPPARAAAVFDVPDLRRPHHRTRQRRPQPASRCRPPRSSMARARRATARC